jgi:hypothetical protein
MQEFQDGQQQEEENEGKSLEAGGFILYFGS